ncbi:peptide-n(4)-(n-acetyl-beta-glucosaminyl)asparagine amidase [Anaeramoeba ignava]|uniref:Peptide-n(4)-(N-acetyl-beta-glucosaminyl)asparagine amidase n=1 Tax=Anaeramoeba ignava TaxID=1746090 RepID=A0A9Q0LER6_ANAIG|nr:peptide-n(4)-(n-acetyl-beta-glucosaminyl)asparagine amidase [Anaeramoeba ignava]
MRIVILAGCKEYEISISLDSTFEDLKAVIFSITSIQPEEQKFEEIPEETPLETTLKDLNFSDGKTLTLNDTFCSTKVDDFTEKMEQIIQQFTQTEQLKLLTRKIQIGLETKTQNQNLSQFQKSFIRTIIANIEKSNQYEDRYLQEKILSKLPIEKIMENENENKKENEKENEKEKSDYLIIKKTISWFKNEFFHWVSNLPCEFCKSTKTTREGMGVPNQEDLLFGASRVELFRCPDCNRVSRFPRYNVVSKLLETQRGRCGEYANAFTAVLRALGFDVRYIHDWTDHCWTEVFIPSWNRWVHCDPCENIIDAPRTYEKGWGKKLKWVVGFSSSEVVDVTKRYTEKWEEVLQRRSQELNEEWVQNQITKFNSEVLETVNQEQKKIILLRQEKEKLEFVDSKESLPLKHEETRDRISGNEKKN